MGFPRGAAGLTPLPGDALPGGGLCPFPARCTGPPRGKHPKTPKNMTLAPGERNIPPPSTFPRQRRSPSGGAGRRGGCTAHAPHSAPPPPRPAGAAKGAWPPLPRPAPTPPARRPRPRPCLPAARGGGAGRMQTQGAARARARARRGGMRSARVTCPPRRRGERKGGDCAGCKPHRRLYNRVGCPTAADRRAF